jgi:gas vesicle protein
MAGNRAGAFLGGVIVGTAIGTAIGLLVAPRSGRDTRRLLRKSAAALPEVAEDLSTSVKYQTEKILESAQHSLDDTLERLQEAIAMGKETMQQKQQELQRQARLAEEMAFEAEPYPELTRTATNTETEPSKRSVSEAAPPASSAPTPLAPQTTP